MKKRRLANSSNLRQIDRDLLKITPIFLAVVETVNSVRGNHQVF